MKRYPESLKSRAVQKFLSRGNRSVNEIAKEFGVPLATLYYWCDSSANTNKMKRNKKSQTSDWTAEQKLKVFLETANLTDEQLGAYLRQNGLHSHQIEKWKDEVVAALKGQSTQLKKDPDTILKDQKIKDLEKELARKDKALSEAAALLILKKKVEVLFSDEE